MWPPGNVPVPSARDQVVSHLLPSPHGSGSCPQAVGKEQPHISRTAQCARAPKLHACPEHSAGGTGCTWGVAAEKAAWWHCSPSTGMGPHAPLSPTPGPPLSPRETEGHFGLMASFRVWVLERMAAQRCTKPLEFTTGVSLLCQQPGWAGLLSPESLPDNHLLIRKLQG